MIGKLNGTSRHNDIIIEYNILFFHFLSPYKIIIVTRVHMLPALPCPVAQGRAF